MVNGECEFCFKGMHTHWRLIWLWINTRHCPHLYTNLFINLSIVLFIYLLFIHLFIYHSFFYLSIYSLSCIYLFIRCALLPGHCLLNLFLIGVVNYRIGSVGRRVPVHVLRQGLCLMSWYQSGLYSYQISNGLRHHLDDKAGLKTNLRQARHHCWAKVMLLNNPTFSTSPCRARINLTSRVQNLKTHMPNTAKFLSRHTQ